MIMATFFGEILPVCSRAVDDDDEDEDTVYSELRIHEIWIENVKTEKCKKIIIAIGPTASAFAQVYILSDSSDSIGEIITEIVSPSNEEVSKDAIQKNSYNVYQTNDLVILLCQDPLPPEHTYHFVEKVKNLQHSGRSRGPFQTQEEELFELVGVNKSQDSSVCVLGSAPVNDFKCSASHADLAVPFVRCLKTSTFISKPACPYLEQPNMVSALPAQILTYCEVHKIKAIFYQTFTETMYLDTDSIKTFRKALTGTPFAEIVKENPKAKEMLLKITNRHAQKHSLYI